MRQLSRIWMVVMLVGAAVAVQARTIYLEADGSGDYATVQSAIDDSNDRDVILLRPGTYTGDGNRDLDYKGKAITVSGIDPNDPTVVAATIIDCNVSNEDCHRGFFFHSGEDANSILKGITIENGYHHFAGAIYCLQSSPLIADCVFLDNSCGDHGGAVYNDSNSSPIINNCVFNGNLAWEGAGIYNDEGSCPTISFCRFTANIAGHEGGAIRNNEYSHPTLINCIVSGNLAGASGGGMDNDDVSWPTLTNCIFVGNRAGVSGGAIDSWEQSHPTIRNCIFRQNRALLGHEIYLDDDYPGLATVAYSNIEGGQNEVYVGGDSTLNWGSGNIDTDPLFVDPGYWDPNDTPVDANDDFFVPGDYHLKSQGGRYNPMAQVWVYDDVTSPCIDTGDPDIPIAFEPFLNGAIINLGAYGGTAEASKSPSGLHSNFSYVNHRLCR